MVESLWNISVNSMLLAEVRFYGPLGTMNYGQILSDGPIIASEQILTVPQTPAFLVEAANGWVCVVSFWLVVKFLESQTIAN